MTCEDCPEPAVFSLFTLPLAAPPVTNYSCAAHLTDQVTRLLANFRRVIVRMLR